MFFAHDKFRDENSTEIDGVSLCSPMNIHSNSSSKQTYSHFPTIKNSIERKQIDSNIHFTSFRSHSHVGNDQEKSSLSNSSFKWRLDRFDNANAPIIVLAYKNRKWKNWNHSLTISSTTDRDVFIIHSV
jgi:hypothetical protein